MLELRNLSKSYDFNVFNNINLTLPNVGMIAIIGESGCGKTTLINSMSLLIEAEGSILYNGQELLNISSMRKDRVRGEIFSNIFQEAYLLEEETVSANLSYCATSEVQIDDILQKVGLFALKEEKAKILSGGERQRLCIARAMLRDTPILISDEPTANLDEENGLSIMQLLQDISKSKLVIFVSHNEDYYREYSTHIVEFNEDGIEFILNESNQEDIVIKSEIKQARVKTRLSIKEQLYMFAKSIKKNKMRAMTFVLLCIFSFLSLTLSLNILRTSELDIVKLNLERFGQKTVWVNSEVDGAFPVTNDFGSGNLSTLAFIDFEEDMEFDLVCGRLPHAVNEVIMSDFQANVYFGGSEIALGQIFIFRI